LTAGKSHNKGQPGPGTLHDENVGSDGPSTIPQRHDRVAREKRTQGPSTSPVGMASTASQVGRIPVRLLGLALWLGVAGFGGGFAVIQLVKRILVERQRRMPEGEFLESFAVATALPGPPGTNLLTIVGVRLGGIVGGLLSAVAFLLPSVVVMIVLGALYGHVRNIAALGVFLDGMSVATVGVVAGVTADVGRGSLKRPSDWVLAVLALALLVVHAVTLLEVILASGLYGASFLRSKAGPTRPPAPHAGPLSKHWAFVWPLPLAAVSTSTLLALWVVFARIGLATFGGGFAMIPAIEHEIVSTHHWLSNAAFDDAIVFGQITPGPIAIASTFIGYRVAGLAGALSATLGMFTPPIVLSLIAGRSLDAFQSNSLVQGALRGITPAMSGILAAAAVALWRTSVHGVAPAILALAATAVLVKWKVLPFFVLVAGGAAMLVIASMP
jgi:chromate transporter